MITDRFVDRHIGPRDEELPVMLKATGAKSLDELIEKTVPKAIRLLKPLALPPAMTENEYQIGRASCRERV